MSHGAPNESRMESFMIVMLVLFSSLWSSALAQSSPPDVQALIDTQIKARTTPGMAVGIVDRTGVVEMYFGGVRHSGSKEPIDAQTIFEIGSISKVFTTFLLAQAVAEGRLALSDPVQDHLPDTVQLMLCDGVPITLEHLATHTSGLARMPSNYSATYSGYPADPFAGYEIDAMYDHLSSVRPTRPPGGTPVYSNLGMGLLGHVLEHREGAEYEALVSDRICRPLHMKDTCCTPKGPLLDQLSGAHDGLRPIDAWHISTLEGAGDINSSLRDMLRFAAANLDEGDSLQARMLRRCHELRVDTAQDGVRIGLGWHSFGDKARPVIWHNGATGGFNSFLGFSPSLGRAVVVLSNSNDGGATRMGLHLLEELDDLPTPYIPEETLSPADYAGIYQMEGQAMRCTISVDHGQLVAQLTGQPAQAIFAASKDAFTFRTSSAEITFESGSEGGFDRMVLQQNAATLRFNRIEPDDSE